MTASHDDLVRAGCAWLRRPSKSKAFGYRSACGVVVPELVTWERESPDVIGWEAIKRRGTYPRSYMIECKTSRSDFLSDKSKKHREKGSTGLYRWYLAPKGVISPSELPDGWGLLEYSKGRIRQVVGAPVNTARNQQTEMSMMYSLLRRSEVRGELKNCFGARWGGTKPPGKRR